MKKTIRITAFSLIILILSVAAAVNVNAYTFTDVYEYRDAVETLSSIGVIAGRTATQFCPDENVTRWQMALMMAKLLTGDTDSEKWASSTGGSVFDDVVNNIRHYGGSIAYAASNGIIIGRSDRVFAPEDGIILQDAATMLVRALGYPRTQYDSGYPDTYIAKADELGLFEGLRGVSYKDTLTRGETAQLLYNAFYAQMRFGGTIARDVFAYSDSVIVLTATEEMSLSPRVGLADRGKLVFCELRPDGTLDTSSDFSLDANMLGMAEPNDSLGKSYSVTSVLNHAKILNIEECDSMRITQDSYYDQLTVESSNDYIKIGSTRYEVVPRYSYELSAGFTPTYKEIIIYGIGGEYDSGDTLDASDIYGTNAYYTLTAYDDNCDGYYDRAMYRPYSFALYTKSGSDIKIEGEQTLNLKSNKTNMTGETPVSGYYVIYSYIKETGSLDILKDLPKVTGTVADYDDDEILIQTGTQSSGKKPYKLGNDSLPGAYSASVKSKISENPAVSYVGCSAEFVADGDTILMLKLSDPQGGVNTDGYISYANCAVVQNVYANMTQTNTSILVNVYNMNGTSETLNVNFVNGTAVNELNISYVSAMLAKGDIIEYSQYPSSGVIYSMVSNISSKPYVTASSSTAYKYYIGANTSVVGIGTKPANNTSASITYTGALSMNSDTKVIYFDGTNFWPLSVTNNYNYIYQITSGCSMYATYGPNGGSTVKLMYVRPKHTQSGGIATDFTRILYVSEYSVINRNPDSGAVLYPKTFDFIDGKEVTAKFLDTQTYGYFPVMPGLYKATIDGLGTYRIIEPQPINSEISNSKIVYEKDMELSSLTVSTSMYTLKLDGTSYYTTNLDIYEIDDTTGLIKKADINITKFIVESGTNYIVSVFMTPSSTYSSSRIALLITGSSIND